MVSVFIFASACCYLFPLVYCKVNKKILLYLLTHFLLIERFNRQLFFNDHFLVSKYNIILKRKLHKTIRTIEYVNAKKTLKKTEKMIPNVNNFNKLQRKHLISHCTKSLRDRIENECVYLVHQKINQNLQSLKNFQLVHF